MKLRTWFAVTAMLLMSACASLPPQTGRVETHALTDTASTRLFVDLDHEIQFVMCRSPFAELEHFRKLISSIDVQNRKRHPAEKRFAC